MQQQFQYISDLSKIYSQYNNDDEKLFTAINNLTETQLRDILSEFGDEDRVFRPVNLVRAEIARKALAGEQITVDVVEEMKEKIRSQDESYFNHLPGKFIEQLKTYGFGKRDVFANWQKHWRIFHFSLEGRKKKLQICISTS